jgi:hypothetical protein
MKKPLIAAAAILAVLAGCALNRTAGDGTAFKRPSDYNFLFKAYSVNVTDPALDRRCYFRVFIDKIESGRTSTGLESQINTFQARLSVNRHLLMVEKWVLDERSGKYSKLNNIEQPRPNFFYFEVPDDKIVVVTLVNDSTKGRSMYGVEFEKE